jgi:hypothetical protein
MVGIRKQLVSKSPTSRNPLQSRTVEDYVRSVGQEIASLGAQDPRFDEGGNGDRKVGLLRLGPDWEAFIEW